MLDEERGIYAEGDKKIRLSSDEVVILKLLIQNKNKYTSIDEIQKELEKTKEIKINYRAIRTRISSIRLKLKKSKLEINNRPKIGYEAYL